MRPIVLAIALAALAASPAAAQETNNVAAAPAPADNAVVAPDTNAVAVNDILLPPDEAGASDPLAEEPTVTVRGQRTRFPWGLLGLLGLIGLLGRKRN